MSGDRDVITRCTREGRILWEHVARQLGCSVTSARAQHDPTYQPPHVWEPEPIDLPDALAFKSPYVQGPGVKTEILALIARAPASAETIAARLGRNLEPIRVRLAQLRAAGLIHHDAKKPYTWSIGQGKQSEADEAA